VTDLDARLAEIHALRRAPVGETAEEARARAAHRIALQQRLEREKVSLVATTKPPERRAIVGELRAKGRRLEGYAAVFGTEARIGAFIETIAPGAFAASLAERSDILALLDHDPARLLARTRSGTLRLAEDSRGLAFDLDVPATTLGTDVLALAERNDLGGASFAFTVKRERWDGEQRTLESVDLHEVSIIHSWPAYTGTVVEARARTLSSDLTMPRATVARRYLDSL
jgi:HK97 family phage prohead protease